MSFELRFNLPFSAEYSFGHTFCDVLGGAVSDWGLGSNSCWNVNRGFNYVNSNYGGWRSTFPALFDGSYYPFSYNYQSAPINFGYSAYQDYDNRGSSGNWSSNNYSLNFAPNQYGNSRGFGDYSLGQFGALTAFGSYNSMGVADFSYKPLAVSRSASVSRTNTGGIATRYSGKVDYNFWLSQGYNAEKGQQFAASAKKWSDYAYKNHKKHECVGYVRRAINETFYPDEGTDANNGHYKRFGWACNVGRDFLSNDRHFKKVDLTGVHLDANDIPAGAIVLYDFGYCHDNGRALPHGEVSDGSGHGSSNLTTTLLRNHGKRKEPIEIWIPV